MTGVELVLAALAAGAGAGTSDAAKAAVLEAYMGLRDLLRRRLVGRARAQEVLDAVESEADSWQMELGPMVEESGAAQDETILAMAQRLLALADPGGRHRLGDNAIGHAQFGDTTIQAPDNRGAIGSFYGPVTFGAPAVPPTVPDVP